MEVISKTDPLIHELPGAAPLSGLKTNVAFRHDASGQPLGWAWLAAQEVHRKQFVQRKTEEECVAEMSDGWELIDESSVDDDKGETVDTQLELLAQIRIGRLPPNPINMLSALAGIAETQHIQLALEQRN